MSIANAADYPKVELHTSEQNLSFKMCTYDNGMNVVAAVMQTDGFEYLKASCPTLLTELLAYVAKASEHSVISNRNINEVFDGSDVNGRRVKQRI